MGEQVIQVGDPLPAGTEGQVLEADPFDKVSAFTFGGNSGGQFNGEGGYVVDNGGPTKYGVTQTTMNAFSAARGEKPMDVKTITPDDAKFIAREMYYKQPKFDMLPDRVGVAAFDYGYQSGPVQAIKDLQRVVGVKVDGLMGPGTKKAVERYVAENGEDDLLAKYLGRRQVLYSTLIRNQPQVHARNAKGYANRLAGLTQYLAQMKSQAPAQVAE